MLGICGSNMQAGAGYTPKSVRNRGDLTKRRGKMRLAIDVGGTFIDFVTQDEVTGEIRTEKVRASGELSASVCDEVRERWVRQVAVRVMNHVHGCTSMAYR